MQLKEALVYLQQGNQSFINNGIQWLGVAHTPDDEVEFYIISLFYDEQENYFNIHLQGGDLFSSEGVEDFFGSDDIEDLIAQVPEFAESITYKEYRLAEKPFDCGSEYALKIIFPDLPNPDDCAENEFRAKAINAINHLNKE